MTASCLYAGTVRHRRTAPAVTFRYSVELAYLDLDELPGLLGGLLVRPGPGALRFRRADHPGLGEPSVPLVEAVRELVRQRTGWSPDGPIRLLTALRTFGTCFNPVSFVYCFDRGGERVRTLLAEVTNTPWNERHVYVVDGEGQGEGGWPGGAEPPGGVVEGRFAKAFHVSPFMGMDHEYAVRATRPGDSASVHIASSRAGERAFDATLLLRRRELTPAAVRRHLLRYPIGSVRTLGLIYGNALRLRLRGAPYFPHPASRTGATGSGATA